MSKLWPFKYAPTTFEELILADSVRAELKQVIEDKPNVLLCGPPGCGKGSFVDIFLRETGYDSLKINASDETSVDNIRNKVKSFATALGATDLKIVYLNEADYLSQNAQALCRDLIESVQAHTRFILACNYPEKIIPELHSRCQCVELKNPPAEKIYNLCMKILKSENIEVRDRKEIVGLIKKHYPDIRKIINELQKNVVDGVLDKIVSVSNEDVHEQIFKLLMLRDLDEIRKLLRSNPINYGALYLFLFDKAGETKNPAEAVLAIGEAYRWSCTVDIQEINLLTAFVDMVKKGVV